MIWVTWRQQRVQILATLGIVLLVSAILVYVRMDAIALLPDMAVVSEKYNQFLQYFVLAMLVLPALLGMFAGAPLFAREIEQGTHIFGLTQSISRRRWLVSKFAVAGGTTGLLMFALGLIAAWALAPLNFVLSGRMAATMFETQGVTVGVYTLLAFVVGATAGLLLRNTLAAMVVTLVAYTVLVMTVANEVRPHYATPTRYEGPVDHASRLEPWDSMTVSYGYLDAKGNEVGYSPIDCARTMRDPKDCMVEKGVVASYSEVHLAGQFWRFQLTELALFLVLSGGVVALGLFASRRRLT
ncbi:hypothetical protein JOF56_007783 [Kibdelosporangium banguiense]|uniref:ABC transporter permease n=1 Tax=Kibdelosporangium banguiense TaxID=1365924 RepID=A0ABS4TTU6_9PSEU|nr:ABC transporter permease [Kibdelosporangium banguiense]MBP2327398.1 hypothetical protein [Kibdelosporangium banguiense]